MKRKRVEPRRFHNAEMDADQADERCHERLKEELELDDEAVEVIMSLRRQVILLQTRLRAMEFTLATYQIEYGADRKQASQEFLEASWEDIIDH